MKRAVLLWLLAAAPLAVAPLAGAPPRDAVPGASASTAPPEHTPVDLAHAASVAGAPRGVRLTGAALEAEAKRIWALLRCPVCQGLSVADSPSPMATNMREQVRELVAAGFDEDQVLSYFEASYGEFVRLAPPLRGVNWLVWLAPALGLVAGLGIVTWVLRGAGARGTETADATLIEPGKAPAVALASGGDAVLDPLPDDPALARAILRVRETAYGWPDGRRPGKG